ncbi:ion channel [Aquimarina sp. M1]|uniref:Membrane protein n=3 Tax=Nonlabens TaxID=363408 RepID=L7WAG2_NONDD|nr:MULTISPECIES: ion channel [Flavobacteriaceae]AEE19118.1 Ion transport 2 domain protein [Dokdonia sp. 4H-3-7-5]AGC75858.1 membrane protein [Nonlabens dokdonensis DSW-6]MBF4984502.1 two pore domain potassium channel family protein [Nonlabens mediterrranea]PZX43541.1 ion channel [Nonlabens dokdonensis]
MELEKIDSFYKQLFRKAGLTIAVILVVAFVDIGLISNIEYNWNVWMVFMLTVVKIFFIVHLSFSQLVKIISQSHLLSHVLVLFTLLIGLIIFSFASDFAALHLIDDNNFKSNYDINSSIWTVFFEYFYLSIITFSSVGYGDIVPVSIVAKSTVILEVGLRFFVLVFGIANVNQIKINQE